MIDLSVIIPVYNAEPYLERCITALLAQDYPAERFEILLIDNNSPDGSFAIARRHGMRVRLLHEPKQGAYAARNHGLHRAQGRIIAFTDPDCVPAPDWLSRIAARFEKSDAQVVIGPTPPPPAPSWAMRLLYAYEHHKERYVFGGSDITAFFGHTNNMAVRRETLEHYGPFDERARGADTLFVRRVVDAAGASAVAYEPALAMEHLEIGSLRDYFRKIHTYGRSQALYSQVLPARELTSSERWRIYRQAVRGERLSPIGACALLGLLALGMVYWRTGARAARRGKTDGVIAATPLAQTDCLGGRA